LHYFLVPYFSVTLHGRKGKKEGDKKETNCRHIINQSSISLFSALREVTQAEGEGEGKGEKEKGRWEKVTKEKRERPISFSVLY